jgi:hypothetical protein
LESQQVILSTVQNVKKVFRPDIVITCLEFISAKLEGYVSGDLVKDF